MNKICTVQKFVLNKTKKKLLFINKVLTKINHIRALEKKKKCHRVNQLKKKSTNGKFFDLRNTSFSKINYNYILQYHTQL